MVVHPAPGNWTGTLVNALMGRGGELRGGRRARSAPGSFTGSTRRHPGSSSSPRPSWRTGVSRAAIAARRISRLYAAMAWGHLDADTLTVAQPIARDPRDRKRMAIVSNGKAGPHRLHAARAFLECGPASRAAAFGPHASDPRPPRVGRTSGARRRHVRRRWRAQARRAALRSVISCMRRGSGFIIRSSGTPMECAPRYPTICAARSPPWRSPPNGSTTPIRSRPLASTIPQPDGAHQRRTGPRNTGGRVARARRANRAPRVRLRRRGRARSRRAHADHANSGGAGRRARTDQRARRDSHRRGRRRGPARSGLPTEHGFTALIVDVGDARCRAARGPRCRRSRSATEEGYLQLDVRELVQRVVNITENE